VSLIPEASRCTEVLENDNYLEKSHPCLALPKSTLRKVKSLPILFRSISPQEGSQDLQVETATALRSYEPLKTRGGKIDEKDEHENPNMTDSDLQRVIEEILYTTYGSYSLESGSEVQGCLTDTSHILTLLKMKGLLSQVIIRNEILKRGLDVSYEQLTHQLELLSKPNNVKNRHET